MTVVPAFFSESDVEDAIIDWLVGLGWSVAHGPDIAPVLCQNSALLK